MVMENSSLMEVENSSLLEMENSLSMMGKGIIAFPSSKITSEEYTTCGEEFFDKRTTNNRNKRRLVITTMSVEPLLIEIRPNIVEPQIHSFVCNTTQCETMLPLVCNSTQCEMIHSVVSNSTQCEMIQMEGQCKRNSCLEHMKLWNELYQLINDTNISSFLEEDWFMRQNIVKNAVHDVVGGMNCKDLWPYISSQALHFIKNLKEEVQREKEDRERYALALTNAINFEEQFHIERTKRSEDGKHFEAIILELQNKISNQSEEIRRLWTDNLTLQGDGVEVDVIEGDVIEGDVVEGDGVNENKHEDAMKLNQRILDLELELSKEIKEHKIELHNQEEKCGTLQLKIDELERNQVATLIHINECDNLKSKVEELDKEKVQVEDKTLLIIHEDSNGKIYDYKSLLKERDMLKEELDELINSYNQTTNKLHDSVAKKRRLESEGERDERSNLTAALYELENELDTTILTIESLQSNTLESINTLSIELQTFQESMKESMDSKTFEIKSSTQNDIEIIKGVDSINNYEVLTSNALSSNEVINKVIPETRSFITKLTQENEKLLIEISNVRIAIQQAMKIQSCQVKNIEREMNSKMENMEAERESFLWKEKVFDEENKTLEEENSKLRHQVFSLKSTKSKLNLEMKSLEKEMEEIQESVRNLREENRRLLKEAKWKSVGKQGGYQESLIIQEWEKKLQKLEADYEIMRHAKKDLVKEKHRLEDDLDRALEKGCKGGGSEDQKLEEELFIMTQDRNKLRKIKIALAIENVSLKESLVQLQMKVDVLEKKCESLKEWKEKVQKLEEECEDSRDWKKKAEALEVECEDLRESRMKVEAIELECKKWNFKAKELEEDSKKSRQNIDVVEEECKFIRQSKDCLEKECNDLRESNVQLEKECQNLREGMDHLKVECNNLREFKEKIENSNKNDELPIVEKLKDHNILESEVEKLNDGRRKVEVEVENRNLDQSQATDVECCSIQEYLEKIDNLEQENEKLCLNHQISLDRQWDVFQVDLKTFEAKVEELETECESIRRDHLSSMVENAELVREKDRLLTLYKEQKYNYEILETANECLQKNNDQNEVEKMKERNDYHASIDNLNRQVVELEATFSERLRQQAANYSLCLAPKSTINGRENVTLTRQEYEILLAEKQ